MKIFGVSVMTILLLAVAYFAGSKNLIGTVKNSVVG
jgi:hypothetical protein